MDSQGKMARWKDPASSGATSFWAPPFTCALGLRPRPEPPTMPTPTPINTLFCPLFPGICEFSCRHGSKGQEKSVHQAPSPGCAPGLLSFLSKLQLHGWDVQGSGVKMQARHLACLVGHLSQKPIVGGLVECLAGYWL